MTSPQTRSLRNRLTKPLVVGAVLFVLLAGTLLLPTSRMQIATVDDQHQWSEDAAPPRRQIVWQPAVPVAPDSAAHQNSTSHIRPQIADGGRTLYFTLRANESDFEIVRSEHVEGGWSPPERVEELCSSADDIGPVIRDDGRVLYLYSNRDGGLGGMDLYVSRRDGDRWTRPINLGPKINSPAHDYDPAISPDSHRLFFSSNRSKKMHRELAAGTFDPKRDHWSTTLRNDLGNRTFDLYVAEFDTQSNLWKHPTPLEWLNTIDHNEGAPFVSPDGAFLFFASDRPTQRNESKNYDLYRARLGRTDLAAENLGAGVNTPANEMEPCLSAAGFQLLFSRSDRDHRSRYSLYKCTAKEVYHDAKWEQSNWHALSGALAGGLKRILDYFWLLLLALATLAVLAWLIRQIRVHRVAISGFLLAALFIHLFLVTSSFFVFFQHQIADRLRNMFEEEPVVATQVLLNSTAPERAEQPAFDSVAELEMPDPVQPVDVTRHSIDAPQAAQPIELAKPQQVASRSTLEADLPSDPVVATILIEDNPADVREVMRRAPMTRVLPSEQVNLEQTVAVDHLDIRVAPTEPTELQQQPLPPPSEPIDAIAVESVQAQAMPIEEQRTDIQRADSTPAIESSPVAVKLQRAKLERRTDSTEIDSAVPSESISAVEKKDVPTPATQSVDFDRAAEMLAATMAQPEPLALSRLQERAPPLPSESLDPIVADHLAAGSPETASPQSPLKRAPARTFASIDRDAPDATESINVASHESQPAPASPQPDVDSVRQETNRTVIDVSALPVKSANAPTPHLAELPERIAPNYSSLGLVDRRDPVASRLLSRRPSQRASLYADANVSLQSLLLRRKLDEATKVQVVKQFGGNDETLATIRRGLSWIERHQARDGHWGLHDFHEQCEDHKKCNGHGNTNSDTAGTALALLPFLGDGNTHQEGPYQETVARGITWLVEHQKPDGNLFTGGTGNAFMYSHGIATIALCECYGMSGDESLRQSAQRAIDFIVAAQDPKSGGWRYKPREFGDTSVVGWQVMALKSGQMADLHVPEKTLAESKRWLDSVAGKKNQLGQFAYQGRRYNPAMTAEAILCLQYMSVERESDELSHGVEFLSKNLPKKGRETSYYWYYGTQAMFHFQGDHWPRWNNAIHPLLVESQQQAGPMIGSWDPRDQWEKGGGRIYATSLRILMLEVYYRHLPIYQVIE